MNKIRSKYVKDSLLDYESLTKALKENTTSAVKDLLSEAVRDTYNKILTESEDEYDEEETDDTTYEPSAESNNTESNDEASVDSGSETSTTEVTPDGAVEKSTSGTDGEGNEWSEFEKYKVSDDKYDFSQAEDDEIIRAYKLMKDDDQLVVTKDGEMVHLTDNETGADYLIDLNSVPEEDEAEGGDNLGEGDSNQEPFESGNSEDNSDAENDGDTEYELTVDDGQSEDSNDGGQYSDEEDNEEDKNTMDEQRIFEIVLNEYDSNVGYTDNYQKKDVMTNPGMSEPAKSSSVNDWDAGVPKGTEKPWSGRKPSKDDKPFTAKKGTTVEESFEECGDMFEEDELGDYGEVSDMPVEEGASLGGRRGAIGSGRSTGTKQHVPDVSGEKNPYGKHHVSKNAQYYERDAQNESIIRKANAIFEENKQLKKVLNDFRHTLNEAAVTNVNLGKIIKLISENTTTSDEKMEIISRFGKEAKTIGDANALYESISNDLKKKGKMNINEDKQFTANSSNSINETKIYMSNDLVDSLGLMHRVCKF